MIQIMPSPNIRFVSSTQSKFQPPNLRVYSLAAEYVKSGKTRTIRSALVKAYKKVFGKAGASSVAHQEVIDLYERQYRRLFFTFPWWSNNINKVNRTLHVKAFDMMIQTCISSAKGN